MSVPYEKIVTEDLNVGLGEVTVTMPGGGTAVGNKVGLQSFPAIAFAASMDGTPTQTIATGSTFTLVELDTEDLDTNGWYDPATYLFTSLEPGVYIVTAELTLASFTGTLTGAIYKNSAAAYTMEAVRSAAAATITLCALISVDGIDDTISLRCKHSVGAGVNLSSAKLAASFLGYV